LNATSALGVFAQVKGGASLRPPLQWSNNVTHVVFTHPYILTLNDEFITVHRSVSTTYLLTVCCVYYLGSYLCVVNKLFISEYTRARYCYNLVHECYFFCDLHKTGKLLGAESLLVSPGLE